jgi:hypothetical protein
MFTHSTKFWERPRRTIRKPKGFAVLLCLGFAWAGEAIAGGGLETFAGFSHTGSSYASGTFAGQDGSIWTYANARGDLQIDGASPTLKKGRGAYVHSGTIPGGVGVLSLKYRKAEKQGVACSVLVNGVPVGTISGGDGSIQTWTSGMLNVAGGIQLTLTNSNSGGAITVDDISWTEYYIPAAVSLDGLSRVYDGSPKSASVQTVPAGLGVAVTYSGSPTPPAAAGHYGVVATVVDPIYAGTDSGVLAIAKADQSIDFTIPGSAVATGAVALAATASSGLPASFAVISGPAAINPDSALVFSGSGAVVVSALQPGDANWNPAANVTRTVQVLQAAAAVTLDGLTQVYDGTPRNTIATTEPAGLAVDLLYNGSPVPPVQAGSYSVLASVNDAVYAGSASGTLVVAKAVAAVLLEDLDREYDGEPKHAAVTTTPAGLAVEVTYNGSLVPPTDIGQYDVQAMVFDPNYEGSASGLMMLVPQVELEDLEQDFDGTPKTVKVKTKPVGVTTLVTYDGQTNPPVNAGEYSVTVEVCKVSCHGRAWGLLKVKKASQQVVFSNPGVQAATNRFVLGAEATSGLPVDYAVLSGPALLEGDELSFVGAGEVSISAFQDGDDNWEEAPALTRTFSVEKVPASVTLEDLLQVYDSTPRAVAVSTDPPGLMVEIFYNGGLEAPTAAGTYVVVAVIADPLHEGSVSGTLVVAKADQSIDFPEIEEQLQANVIDLPATASSGLPVLFSLVSGPGLLNGNTLSFSGTGQVVVAASQPGDGNWNAAGDVARSIQVIGDAVVPGLVVSAVEINVREGGEGRFFVRLDCKPDVGIAVAVAHVDGDPGLRVASGEFLQFTPANWNVWQAVTLAADPDDNADSETAAFRVSVLGGDEERQVVAASLDKDIGVNVALAASGSSISGGARGAQAIDGIHSERANYAYVVSTSVPPSALTLDLKIPTVVSRVRVHNWDWDARTHRYTIEYSPDGVEWFMLADASGDDRSGWDDWEVSGILARYLRLTGLSNSANGIVCIPEWEVYGDRPGLVVGTAHVNVRENGQARFFVRLDQAPAAHPGRHRGPQRRGCQPARGRWLLPLVHPGQLGRLAGP